MGNCCTACTAKGKDHNYDDYGILKEMLPFESAVTLEENRVFYLAATKSRGTSDGLHVEDLIAMAKNLQCSDYNEAVLQRVFDVIPRDYRGKVGRSEFLAAVSRGPASATLKNLVAKFKTGTDFGFVTPSTYDYSLSTNDNYKSKVMNFVGEFKEIRKDRDYSYHVNYTEDRQSWQDAAIKSIIGRTAKQPAPWLVYTCGPMGVGKGYALDWMSKQGFFPLEHIVHVDPDAFKMMMPEWSNYVSHSAEEAGTLCHMESSFMMEIAQEAAMQLRQNIWIDGSLRNAEFYAVQFQELRTRWPHYKICIFYVYAPEAIIRQRIQKRAKETGRDVPEHLIEASLGAMDRSLNVLTPLSDFVARISNEGTAPVLTAFETIKAQPSWEIVHERFARIVPDPFEFPNALAPFVMVSVADVQTFNFTCVDNTTFDFVLEGSGSASLLSKLLTMLPDRLRLAISLAAILTLPDHDRKLANIHEAAISFSWVYPYMENPLVTARMKYIGCTEQEIDESVVCLLQRGGFVYFDRSGKIVQINVIAHGKGDGYIQFGRGADMVDPVLDRLRERLQPPPRRYREASGFVWFGPNEIFENVSVGGDYGAFAFELDDSESDGTVKSRRIIRFPVIV